MKRPYHIEPGALDATVEYLRNTFAAKCWVNPTTSRTKIRAFVTRLIADAIEHAKDDGFCLLGSGGVTVQVDCETSDVPYVELLLDPWTKRHEREAARA